MSSCRTPSNKVVRRLGQPRADKFVQNVGKVQEVKTFPDELAYTSKWLVAERRQNKVVKQLGKPRRNSCAYLSLRKSDERRFSQAVGRISQCLAAEHRLKQGCDAACLLNNNRIGWEIHSYWIFLTNLFCSINFEQSIMKGYTFLIKRFII